MQRAEASQECHDHDNNGADDEDIKADVEVLDVEVLHPLLDAGLKPQPET